MVLSRCIGLLFKGIWEVIVLIIKACSSWSTTLHIEGIFFKIRRYGIFMVY